ncbi:MAG: DNA phosphorothioation system sulfurtransferase DndC [Rhodobacteraceae bacterium]|jgi:DNA sulfur modification protein DndC|uniref:DNA phosphorothioation system sulfurtransferase DndC n=1 Tax=Roseobacteraceae TaxID=2854170 RepID=UPI0008E59CA8|nr:DNA phosphorothioation system sulfurtransferase DndC [Salipiger profundus]MBR9766279.1 DNA phosphorothioation system sulfurtransferase DndC [Paracoccaceae bacterium]MBR9824075.1 DNA phosphorothioation system sulfurtransferase DndC [Paracoccaceae bacterium]SFD95222.1 DNA sulfur modification protein DndC [Salipiger profundus]
MDGAKALVVEDESEALFRSIRAELLDEYRQDHDWPWIIGYSGGKDSTLVTHLAFEMLLSLPPSQRKRPVHIVANDTLVESPLVVQHIIDSVEEIGNAANAFGLPIITKITRPAPEQSFWVNLIGRGYPSPNRSFRWCTDRMKILPTSRYIKSQVDAAGQAVLLLGVRRSESSTRAASVNRYDNGERLNKHNDLVGCMVFRPIVDLDTDDVWEFLALNEPPWGGSHLKLIGLYRNASGGECPVVTSKEDAPSCGTTSSRFGCWTCTVVEKDRSLEGFVEAGYAEFTPLLDFRDWLASIRNQKERRQARRRDGRITITDGGTFIPGPFTLQTRSEIFERLRDLEKETGQNLITDEEVDLIHQLWSEEIAGHGKVKTMSVREIVKEK